MEQRHTDVENIGAPIAKCLGMTHAPQKSAHLAKAAAFRGASRAGGVHDHGHVPETHIDRWGFFTGHHQARKIDAMQIAVAFHRRLWAANRNDYHQTNSLRQGRSKRKNTLKETRLYK